MKSTPQQLAFSSYVLKALRPESFGESHHTDEEPPSFLADSNTWLSLFEYALCIHAALPFALWLNHRTWRHQLPLLVSSRLEEELRVGRMRLAMLDEEFEAALTALSAENIPVLVVKGMDLGRRYYPDRLLRPMTDVDIVVPPGSFENALATLKRARFSQVGPLPKGRFRVEMARSQHTPVVELHQFLQEGDTNESIAEIWARTTQLTISGLTYHVLHVEDALAYLIRHAAVQHLIESPVWLNDIHLVIKSKEFDGQADWTRVLQLLGKRGCRCASWFVLRLLVDELGTPVPPWVLNLLHKSAGKIRPRLLLPRASSRQWFPWEGRALPWTISSRLLLRDTLAQSLAYAFKKAVAP